MTDRETEKPNSYWSHTGERDSALHDIVVPNPIYVFCRKINAETQGVICVEKKSGFAVI